MAPELGADRLGQCFEHGASRFSAGP
jgi:hypothetical protein